MRHVAVMLTAASPLPLTELMNATFDSGCRLAARPSRSPCAAVLCSPPPDNPTIPLPSSWIPIARRLTFGRGRFAQHGLQSLWEIAPGGVLNPRMDRRKFRKLWPPPYKPNPRGGTQWSCRSLAAQQGVSKSTLNNIWRSHNLKFHFTKTFKLSRGPRFLKKLTEVVGLYLNPPQQAMDGHICSARSALRHLAPV